jgi:hypothetical protein
MPYWNGQPTHSEKLARLRAKEKARQAQFRQDHPFPGMMVLYRVPVFMPGKWGSFPELDAFSVHTMAAESRHGLVPVQIGHQQHARMVGFARGFVFDNNILTADLVVGEPIVGQIERGELHAVSLSARWHTDACDYVPSHVALLTRDQRPGVHTLPSLTHTVRRMREQGTIVKVGVNP